MSRSRIESRLAEARDYRSFLKAIVEESGGCAQFSRRAKFSSRSFLSEVIRGNRRLSHDSYNKVNRAVKVSSQLRRLFQLLVAIEEPDLFPLKDRASLPSRIEELRKKIVAPEKTSSEDLFVTENLPVVFAALGTAEEGATRNEIVRRTKLSGDEVSATLSLLEQKGLAQKKSDRYFPNQLEIDLFDLGGDMGFRHAFSATSEKLRKLVTHSLPTDSQMFFYTAFAVNEAQLGQFKQELREAVLQCIDSFQAETGDRVIRLNLGYF